MVISLFVFLRYEDAFCLIEDEWNAVKKRDSFRKKVRLLSEVAVDKKEYCLALWESHLRLLRWQFECWTRLTEITKKGVKFIIAEFFWIVQKMTLSENSVIIVSNSLRDTIDWHCSDNFEFIVSILRFSFSNEVLLDTTTPNDTFSVSMSTKANTYLSLKNTFFDFYKWIYTQVIALSNQSQISNSDLF